MDEGVLPVRQGNVGKLVAMSVLSSDANGELKTSAIFFRIVGLLAIVYDAHGGI